METCHRCGKRFASEIEQSAIQKKHRNADPAEWEALIKKISRKICVCPERPANAFTSSQQPPDLQWHDKFDDNIPGLVRGDASVAAEETLLALNEFPSGTTPMCTLDMIPF
jgi:hypothetical protein